jgi:hypothetical protein
MLHADAVTFAKNSWSYYFGFSNSNFHTELHPVCMWVLCPDSDHYFQIFKKNVIEVPSKFFHICYTWGSYFSWKHWMKISCVLQLKHELQPGFKNEKVFCCNTECPVTLCQYFKILFLRSSPAKNVTWIWVWISTVTELWAEIQDDVNRHKTQSQLYF